MSLLTTFVTVAAMSYSISFVNAGKYYLWTIWLNCRF